VPADLVVESAGLRLTAPALTALDLCPSHGGAAIDAVLRSRRAGLADLHQRSTTRPVGRGRPYVGACCSTRGTSRGRRPSGRPTGFTWAMLEEHPEAFVAAVLEALR
jgi:hypothetical protein